MNWGKGIIAGMALFMLFIISMCVYMFTMPVDEYDHQYYEKGLNFDKDFNKEKQVSVDHAQPTITITGQFVKVNFTTPATGTVSFLRPSSEALDKVFKLDGGTDQAFSMEHLPLGRWQMVVDWQSNHKAYLYHQEIYIK
jgi:nitrogen fixation protein FixH